MKKYILLALLSLATRCASAQHISVGVTFGVPVVVAPPVVVVPAPVVVYQPVSPPPIICDPIYRYYYPYPVYLGASFRPVPGRFYSHPPRPMPPHGGPRPGGHR